MGCLKTSGERATNVKRRHDCVTGGCEPGVQNLQEVEKKGPITACRTHPGNWREMRQEASGFPKIAAWRAMHSKAFSLNAAS